MPRLAKLAIATLFGFLPFAAAAQTVVWKNTSTVWNTASSWNPATAPGAGITAEFDSAKSKNPALNATSTVSEIVFTSNVTTGYTLSGGAGPYTLTLTGVGGYGIDSAAATLQTFNGPLALGGAQTWRENGGSELKFNKTIDLAGNALTVEATNSADTIALAATTSGAISSSVTGGALVKNGAGLLTFGNVANTFDGGFTLNAGTAQLGNNASFGTGAITLAGGALTSTASRTLANDLSVTGAATIENTGATANATFTFSSNNISSSGGSPTLTVTGTGTGTTILAFSGSGFTFAAPIALDTNTTLSSTNTSGTQTFSGVISGPGGFKLNGAGGTVIFSGANTYTGATTITAGTLQLGAANGLSSASDLSLATAGTLNLNGYAATAASLAGSGGVTFGTNGALTLNGSATTTFSGQFTGDTTSTLTQAGSGTLTLTAAQAAFSGNVVIQSGVVQVNNNTALGTGLVTLAGGTLQAAGSRALTNDLSVTAASTLSNVSPTGNATFTFSSNNISSSGGSPSLTVSGTGTGTTTLAFSGSGFTFAAPLALDTGATLSSTNASGTQTFSGVISGAGGYTLNSSGNTVLSGVNTFSGGATLTNGELDVGNDSALGTGTVTLGAATLAASGGAINLANTVLQTGNATIGGTQNLTLSGAFGESTTNTLAITNTGATTFSGSTLTLDQGVAATTLTLNVGSASGGLVIGNVIQDGTFGGDALKLTGGGLLTLNGANTFTGGVTLTSGELDAGNDAALGTGTLNLNGGTLAAVGGARTLANAASLTVNSTIGGAQNLTFTGGLTQTASRTLSVANTGATAFSTGALTAAGTLDFNVASASGGVTVNSVIQDGASAGRLALDGGGTLTLTNANTFTGTTTVNAGTLNLQNAAALGTAATNNVTVNSGGTLALQNGLAVADNGQTLTLNGTGVSNNGALAATSGNNTWSGAIRLGSAALINNNAAGTTLTFGGAISGTGNDLTLGGAGNTVLNGVLGTGAGGLIKDGAGTLTLNAANTYTGATTISGGTLRYGAANALSSGTAVTLASGATLDLNGQSGAIASLAGTGGTVNLAGGGALTLAGNASTTFSGTIASDAASVLTKGGTGVFTLGASQSFSGNLVLNGGTIALGGFNQTINTLTVTGNSILDFSGGPTTLSVTTLIVNAGAQLTIENWTDTIDYFYTANNPGSATLGNILFAGYTTSDTEWLPYADGPGLGHQVTPVPESAVYGAIFLGLALVFAGGLRLRSCKRNPPESTVGIPGP